MTNRLLQLEIVYSSYKLTRRVRVITSVQVSGALDTRHSLGALEDRCVLPTPVRDTYLRSVNSTWPAELVLTMSETKFFLNF